MLAILAAIILLPLVEIVVLSAIAPHLGFLGTIGLLAGSFVLGVLMVIWQGREALHRWRQGLSEGRLATEAASDALLICLAGILLILPGVVSDVLAFFLLIPFTRGLIKAWLAARFQGTVRTETFYHGPEGTFHERSDGDLIDSYVVRREEVGDDSPPPPGDEITYLDEPKK